MIFMIYARVSPKGSNWSAGETSIALQLSECREHILRRHPDAEFIEVYDEFKSGKNLSRPGIARIIADLDRRPVPWSCLVVWNLDRLSRSLRDAIPILSKLRDADCQFVSVKQEYLSMTGAMARFMLHQAIAIAELERGMTSERVSAKMQWILSKGKIPWGRVPLGYVRSTDGSNTLLIDETKAEMIRDIFKLYLAGRLSFGLIAERYPGVFRNRQHIYKLLRHRMYVGEIVLADGKVLPGEHQPIVDRQTFEETQAMLTQKRRNFQKSGIQTYDYLVSGLLRCHCGRCMTGHSIIKPDRRYFYYKCTDPLCKNAVNAETLDQSLLSKLTSIFNNELVLKSTVADYLQKKHQAEISAQPDFKTLSADLTLLQEEEKKLNALFLGGLVTASNSAYFNDQLLSVRTQREAVERKLQRVISAPVDPHGDIIPSLLIAAGEWAQQISADTADFATKRNLIMSMVKSLTCSKRTKTSMTLDLALVMPSSKLWWAIRDLNP